MLPKEENELMCNTDRGTPMGELFRRFWLPVMLCEELPAPDCVPVRLKVMGEDLIAFRDTEGKVGIVDAYCPHRGAAMFFGRNEHNGLRCIYHGWKFNTAGECVDMPNCPEGDSYRNKIHITSYPTMERAKMVWAFMGPVDRTPPFPHFQYADLPDTHVFVSKFIVECNYMQSMDGGPDPSHGRFLHSALGPGGDSSMEARTNLPETLNPRQGGRAGTRRGDLPDFTKALPTEDSEMESGAYMTQIAELPDGRWSASTNPWTLPIFDCHGLGGPNVYSSNIRIPIDNRSIFWYRLRWSPLPFPADYVWELKHGGYVYPELIPGSWRTAANIHNDYQLDRVAQKQFTFSGIKCFPLQDVAMGENQWGPIADRTQEHLCSSDYHIIYVRRRMIRAAKALVNGIEPTEPWHPEGFRNHISNAVAATKEEAIAQAHAKAGEWIVPVAQPGHVAQEVRATVS